MREPPQTQVSFIVPMFNHVAQSQAMVATLLATIPSSLVYEIILIDDCSSDATSDWLATLTDCRIKKLSNAQNLGYAKTNNLAVGVATGEILALLNNDLLLCQDWLEPMLAALRNSTLNAGIVGNIQIAIGSGQIDHAGIAVDAYAKIEHVRTSAPPSGDLTARVRPTFAVTGACALLYRADFHNVGGFDESYLNGGEDVDLCLKLRRIGKRAYVVHSSTVMHHVSLSRDRIKAQNERNSRRIFAYWRKEIKREVASAWKDLLCNSSQIISTDLLDGNILESVRNKPNALAQVLAENAIRQEECYWSRILDGNNINSGISDRCSIIGLTYISGYAAGMLTESAELSVDGLFSARNFFVCGRIVASTADNVEGRGDVRITIVVNGIQEKNFRPQLNSNFNLSIVRPILLTGVTNTFTIKVDRGSAVVGTRSPVQILITHFVLDDQFISIAPMASTQSMN